MIVWKKDGLIVGFGDMGSKMMFMLGQGATPEEMNPEPGTPYGEGIVFVREAVVINIGLWEEGAPPEGAVEETRMLIARSDGGAEAVEPESEEGE